MIQTFFRLPAYNIFLCAFLVVACGNEEDSTSSTSSEYNDGTAVCTTQEQPPPANYPYDTWQGSEPNCAPRAFETATGVYDPRLHQMNGEREWIDSGGQTFWGRGQGQQPIPGDIVGYDYDQNAPGFQGHAGVCTGYTADGKCIIATGHSNNPYDVREYSELDQTYTPAYPN